MSKRSHDESLGAGPIAADADNAGAAEPDATQATSTKRLKQEPCDDGNDALKPTSSGPEALVNAAALSMLLENADDLLKVLKDLKARKIKKAENRDLEPKDLKASTKTKLVELSQKLAPVFQDLAGTGTAGVAPISKDPLSSITAFTSADATMPLLPLPTILDPVLESASLTHMGALSNPNDTLLSYERLEWIGDAYLEVIASCFLFRTFLESGPGGCSPYREMLVRNQTLSSYSTQFGLDKRARLPAEFQGSGRRGGEMASSKERIKVLGDIFEAYLGAVIISDPENGIARAADFLRPLWARALERQIRDEERRQLNLRTRLASGGSSYEKTAKEKLAELIVVPGVKLEYRDIVTNRPRKHRDFNMELVTLGCFLYGWGEDGKQIGFGSALGKKEAGQRAAQAALDNKKSMKVYADKKKAFLAARETQTPPQPA